VPSCVDDGEGNDDDEEAIFLCLHVLPEGEVEGEVELEFGFEADDEFEFGVDELEEEVPDKSARTGTGAFGAGVGIET
jgi:hypothetical protein